jgi:hypothetical protein
VTDSAGPGPALPPPPPPAPPPVAQGRPGGIAPYPRAQAPSRGWRTTIAVATTILVVVIGVNIADASVPLPEDPAAIQDPALPDASFPVDPGAPQETLTPVDPGPIREGETIDLGYGYSARPSAGWSVVSQDEGATVLQKGDAVLVIATIPSQDTPEDLAAWYRDAWFGGGSFTGGDPESRTIGADLPAAQLDYTGAFEGTTVDGRIVTASQDGAGLLLNVFAPTGSLSGAVPDLESLLESVRLGEG